HHLRGIEATASPCLADHARPQSRALSGICDYPGRARCLSRRALTCKLLGLQARGIDLPPYGRRQVPSTVHTTRLVAHAVIAIGAARGWWVHSGDRLIHPVQGNQGQQGGTTAALWRPCSGGKELVILHDARLEPGFELPTEHRYRLCFGQKGIVTDTV